MEEDFTRKAEYLLTMEWLRDYQGDNEFLCSVRDYYLSTGKISQKQFEAVSKLSFHEKRKQRVLKKLLEHKGGGYLGSLRDFYKENGFLTHKQYMTISTFGDDRPNKSAMQARNHGK